MSSTRPEVGAAVWVDGRMAVVLCPYPDESDDQLLLTPGDGIKLADELKAAATSMLSQAN